MQANSSDWRKQGMLTVRNITQLLLMGSTLLLFAQCTPNNFIRPNPPPPLLDKKPDIPVEPAPPSQDTTAQVIDFNDAFDSTSHLPDSTQIEVEPVVAPPEIPIVENIPVTAMTFPEYRVPSRKVRVAVLQHTDRAVVYSVGNVNLLNKKIKKPVVLRGRILFENSPSYDRVRMIAGTLKAEVTLPCTLRSESDYNFIDIGETTYRGALIISTSPRSGKFTLINLIDMEDYLRGVVPLELGKRKAEDIEALRAQAVAARTYAYKRITERVNEPFDLINTVADQVYGGATVEYREADAAVKSTENLVMTYNDSLIYAYYHSTCGGTTATVSDIWNKSSKPYLVGISDCDPSGKAYCSASAYAVWQEDWQVKQFSQITIDFCRKMFPQKQFSGGMVEPLIDSRFPCGRIKKLHLSGDGWEHDCRGDEIRFIVRRPVTGNPILRSSNFSLEKPNGAIIRCKGKGFGHGVGMCQMGAIGRAQTGHNFVSIVKSYYRGVTIAKVHDISGDSD